MSKYVNLKETGPSSYQKNLCEDNVGAGQNIWNKLEKFSKIGQEKLDICFCVMFLCYCQSLIF